MKYRRKEEGFLTLDLLDFIETGGYILLFGGAESVYVKEYRQRVEQRILDIVASHPVITAIEHGEVVNDTQLLDLERTLRYELTKPGIELTQDNIKKAYGFKTGSFLELARRLLDIDGLPAYEDIVRHQFQTYIGSHTFIADQLRFLRAVLNVFLEKRKLSLPDLYEAPLNAFGQNAVERWFSDEEVKDLLTLTKQLTINGEIHVN
jgi:type I restriction enzyme R subunit